MAGFTGRWSILQTGPDCACTFLPGASLRSQASSAGHPPGRLAGSSGVKGPRPGWGSGAGDTGQGRPQAKPPASPEGAPPPGPAAAGPSEKRGRFERRSRTSDPSGAPRNTGSSGRKLSAARARRPAGRMTKFGGAPRRPLPFLAAWRAADVAARGAEGRRGAWGGGTGGRGAAGAAPRGCPSSPPPPQPARPSLPDLPRGKLRPGEGPSPAQRTWHHRGVEPEDTQRPCFPAQGQDRDESHSQGRRAAFMEHPLFVSWPPDGWASERSLEGRAGLGLSCGLPWPRLAVVLDVCTNSGDAKHLPV